ncbi:MAG: bifunctional folylpolyglutamate synthase/dihydrofolate synthase [Alkalispirochaeta sp.]
MTTHLNTPEDVFERFESRTNLERTTAHLRLYRLERMVALLSRLGEPQGQRPTVHLAGSKGKGSTAAYLTSLLVASGQVVGLYTSPHVTSYRERFTVHRPPEDHRVLASDQPGKAAAEQEDLGAQKEGRLRAGTPRPATSTGAHEDSVLVKQGRRVWAVVESMIAAQVPEDDLPTTFELLTALAFCYFPAVGCDWIVLETGLGGRLDATNVCVPAVTVITRIELEHTDYLGDTRAAIAGEKAGIIKAGVPVILQPQHPEADPVIRRTASERNAPVVPVEPLQAVPARAHAMERPAVRLPHWAGATAVVPAMLGSVHRTNIAAALEAYRYLTTGRSIPQASATAIAAAVATTRLPGRGEVIGDVILDGAHTVESAAALAETVRIMLPVGTRIPIILGVVAGKNVEGIARELARIASVFIVSRPGRFKPGDPADVFRRVTAAGYETILEETPSAAFAEARRRQGTGPHPIVVSGSFYMVAEIRRLVLS